MPTDVFSNPEHESAIRVTSPPFSRQQIAEKPVEKLSILVRYIPPYMFSTLHQNTRQSNTTTPQSSPSPQLRLHLIQPITEESSEKLEISQVETFSCSVRSTLRLFDPSSKYEGRVTLSRVSLHQIAS